MSKSWAMLDGDMSPPRTENACAWAAGNNDDEHLSSSSGWAQLTTPRASMTSGASGWTMQNFSSDSDHDDEGIPAAPVDAVETHDLDAIKANVLAISERATLDELATCVRQINRCLENAQTPSEIGLCAMVYDDVLSKVADCGSHKNSLDKELGDIAIQHFCCEQLRSTESSNPRSLESHVVEAGRCIYLNKCLRNGGRWQRSRQSCSNARARTLL